MRSVLNCTVLTCRTWKTLLALPCFKATILMSLGWFLSILSCSPLQMTSLVGANLNMLHTFVFYMFQCVCMQCWYNPVYLVCSINTSTFKWYVLYRILCIFKQKSGLYLFPESSESVSIRGGPLLFLYVTWPCFPYKITCYCIDHRARSRLTHAYSCCERESVVRGSYPYRADWTLATSKSSSLLTQ